jgi:hypothetical protein
MLFAITIIIITIIMINLRSVCVDCFGLTTANNWLFTQTLTRNTSDKSSTNLHRLSKCFLRRQLKQDWKQQHLLPMVAPLSSNVLRASAPANKFSVKTLAFFLFLNRLPSAQLRPDSTSITFELMTSNFVACCPVDLCSRHRQHRPLVSRKIKLIS